MPHYGTPKKTKDEFVRQAKRVHGLGYDYSLSEYDGAHTKVIIICAKHGEFKQSPSKHLAGRRCPKCAKMSMANKQRKTTEQFIKDAKRVHGDIYDYSLSEYVAAKTKVKIICPEHGVFEQTPTNHLHGKSCYKCAGRYKKKTDEFIQEAMAIHGDKYDYSLVDYLNCKTKVKITCPIHGEFEQSPSSHKKGTGCPKCGDASASVLRMKSNVEFVRQSKKTHGNKYDYSKSIYLGAKRKVTIICHTHGEFNQRAITHINGCGCPHCNKISKGEQSILDYLQYSGLLFIREHRMFKRYRYDFVLPGKKVIIEYHGSQHYKPVEHWGGKKKFKQTQKHDREKRDFAIKYGYRYIVIPYWDEGKIERILDKELNRRNVNAAQLGLFACAVK